MTEENSSQNNQNINLISENENNIPVKSDSSFNLVKKRDTHIKKLISYQLKAITGNFL